MATAITGTVDWTATVGAIDSGARLGRGAADAAGIYAYYPCRNGTGRVFRLDLATGVFTSLYAAAFLPRGATCVALSPDGTTLYACGTTSGGNTPLWSMAADGSSGAVVVESANVLGADTWWRYCPVVGGYVAGWTGGNRIAMWMPGVWVAQTLFHPPGPAFGSYEGPWRQDEGRYFLWAMGDPGAVIRVDRRLGLTEVLAGSGTTGSGGTGDAYAVNIGGVTAVDSDEDGRVYFADGGANVRRLEGGTISAVTGNYGTQGGLLYVPALNCLLVCNGNYEARRVS